MKHIVITGPESTAKSSIATHLSKELNSPLVKEYARFYIAALSRAYHPVDLIRIARQQTLAVRKALNKASSEWLICDTDVLTIIIWHNWKYKSQAIELENLLAANSAQHYLLCKPDIPWVFDPLRESPDDREALFKLYESQLQERNLSYSIIEGDGEKRLNMAVDKAHEAFQRISTKSH